MSLAFSLNELFSRLQMLRHAWNKFVMTPDVLIASSR